MRQKPIPLEVGGNPQFEAAAEEVRMMRESRVVTRGGEALALLVPLPLTRTGRRRVVRGGTKNALLQLAQLAETIEVAPDQPTDVSENKDKYLADIYAGDSVSDVTTKMLSL